VGGRDRQVDREKQSAREREKERGTSATPHGIYGNYCVPFTYGNYYLHNYFHICFQERGTSATPRGHCCTRTHPHFLIRLTRARETERGHEGRRLGGGKRRERARARGGGGEMSGKE
jgi:hypothetical protein